MARWTSRSAPNLATIEKVYQEETGDLGGTRSPDGHHALSGRRRRDDPVPDTRLAAGGHSVSSRNDSEPHPSHRPQLGRDGAPPDPWTLGVILAIGAALCIGLAIGGGYFLSRPDARTCGRHGGDSAEDYGGVTEPSVSP